MGNDDDDDQMQLLDENCGQSLNQRCVRVAELEELEKCVNRSLELEWSDSLKEIAGCKAIVGREDEDAGMSNVSILGIEGDYWLPTDALTNVPARSVRVNVSVDELRACVEKHPAIPWHDVYDAVCPKNGSTAPIGEALIDDTDDGTSKVNFFGEGLDFTAWLPTSCLIDADAPADDNGSDDAIESDAKRQR